MGACIKSKWGRKKTKWLKQRKVWQRRVWENQTCNPSLHYHHIFVSRSHPPKKVRNYHISTSIHVPQENLNFNIHPSSPGKFEFQHPSIFPYFFALFPPKPQKIQKTSPHPAILPSNHPIRGSADAIPPRSSLKLATPRAWWTLRA